MPVVNSDARDDLLPVLLFPYIFFFCCCHLIMKKFAIMCSLIATWFWINFVQKQRHPILSTYLCIKCWVQSGHMIDYSSVPIFAFVFLWRTLLPTFAVTEKFQFVLGQGMGNKDHGPTHGIVTPVSLFLNRDVYVAGTQPRASAHDRQC